MKFYNNLTFLFDICMIASSFRHNTSVLSATRKMEEICRDWHYTMAHYYEIDRTFNDAMADLHLIAEVRHDNDENSRIVDEVLRTMEDHRPIGKATEDLYGLRALCWATEIVNRFAECHSYETQLSIDNGDDTNCFIKHLLQHNFAAFSRSETAVLRHTLAIYQLANVERFIAETTHNIKEYRLSDVVMHDSYVCRAERRLDEAMRRWHKGEFRLAYAELLRHFDSFRYSSKCLASAVDNLQMALKELQHAKEEVVASMEAMTVAKASEASEALKAEASEASEASEAPQALKAEASEAPEALKAEASEAPEALKAPEAP